MGSLQSKSNQQNDSFEEPKSKIVKTDGIVHEVYYGVYVPPNEHPEAEGVHHVYTDKVEALKIIKKYKEARFKLFKFEEDAVDFAIHGPDMNTTSLQPAVDGGEKPSVFRAPKSQESSRLRRFIEQGDVAVVKATVWENPRYLVSSGDTPAIMKEGPRYNGLHVAAKAGNAEMCNMLLTTVGNPAFLALLYGDDNPDSCKDRARILLDLYLNTPDKGMNETPLHFAAKFGAVGVVKVLVSYPQCDKKLKNKCGQIPKDVICSRMPNPDSTLKNDILSLLTDRFYVPILRSEDNSVQPIVGDVFAPDCPPVLPLDPLQPRVEIKAYAGPMDRDQAAIFRKKWKTPPRNLSMNGSQLASAERCNSPLPHSYRLLDSEKGLERVGRTLASQLSVGWKEYWGFLKTFTDLSSPDGLQRLDEYLRHRFEQQAKLCHEESIITNTSDELVKDTSSDSFKMSPISDLCDAFGACSLSDAEPTRCVKHSSLPAVWKRRESPDEFSPFGPANSRLSYIEKSIQVFANRIYDGLVHMSVIGRVQNMKELMLDVLKPEMEHLQSLVGSYMLDDRFSSFLNFQRVHSRISTIVAEKLCNMLVDDLDFITLSLKSILAETVDSTSSGEEDEGGGNFNRTAHRKQKVFVKKQSGQANNQVRCISECILKALENLNGNDAVNGEESPSRYEVAWSTAEDCLCCWETTNFLRNSRKLSSLKRNRAKKSAVNVGRVAVEENVKTVAPAEDDAGFYTPPSSPEQSSRLSQSESDDEAVLAEEGQEVFIEGNNLSRLDVLVLQAIEDCDVANLADYPFVFRWRHGVLLHSQEERAQLLTPKGRGVMAKHSGVGSPWSTSSDLDSPVRNSASHALPRQLLF